MVGVDVECCWRNEKRNFAHKELEDVRGGDFSWQTNFAADYLPA